MTKDSKLFEISCKEFLMEIVKESDTLNKQLTFFQKTLLYDKIKEMTQLEVLSFLINDGKEVTVEQAKDFESKAKTTAKYGATAAVASQVGRHLVNKFHGGKSLKPIGVRLGKGMWIGAAVGTGLLYAFRKLVDPCIRRHPLDREAQLECHVEATRKIVDQIRDNMKDCYNAENPMLCRNNLHKELLKWQTKLEYYVNQREKQKR